MNKKIAITGHTKKIGKALYEAFPNAVGMSRSTGHNITDKDSRIKIIHSCINCDVFINNAHEGFGQVEMLDEMFTAWKDKNKLIINIGVDSVPYTNWQVVHQMYPVQKVALHSHAELLQNQKRTCKITTLALGYVDTEFNKDYLGPKLSYQEIIDTVKWIIEQPSEIKHMVLSAR